MPAPLWLLPLLRCGASPPQRHTPGHRRCRTHSPPPCSRGLPAHRVDAPARGGQGAGAGAAPPKGDAHHLPGRGGGGAGRRRRRPPRGRWLGAPPVSAERHIAAHPPPPPAGALQRAQQLQRAAGVRGVVPACEVWLTGWRACRVPEGGTTARDRDRCAPPPAPCPARPRQPPPACAASSPASMPTLEGLRHSGWCSCYVAPRVAVARRAGACGRCCAGSCGRPRRPAPRRPCKVQARLRRQVAAAGRREGAWGGGHAAPRP